MMQPFQTCCDVTPADIYHILYGGSVVACKECQKQLVTFAYRPVCLRIDIIEIQGVVSVVLRQFQECVEIASAGCDEK